MNFFVDDSIWIYDLENKKGTWCTAHIDGIVKGVYKICEKQHKITIVKSSMRKADKKWQTIEDDLGVDSGTIIVETDKQTLELQLFEKDEKQIGKKKQMIPQNRIFTVQVCKNKKGDIFGIKILRYYNIMHASEARSGVHDLLESGHIQP